MDVSGRPIVTVTSLQRPPPDTEGDQDEETPESARPDAPIAEALRRQVLNRLQAATDAAGADVMVTAQDRMVSMAQTRMAELAETSRERDDKVLEVQFGTGVRGGDWWGWASSLLDWVSRRDAHPLVRPTDATAQVLTGDFSVAMASDWATGLYGAPRIAQTMLVMEPFDLLMHLGDVYYSGTPEEVRGRFLNLWPDSAGRTNRALNGNHDMYSGGYGYFEEILPQFEQEASYFALQNEHWLLVGLDTAWEDHDVDDIQVAWLTHLVEQAGPPHRKLVLFSHHQPFSLLSDQGPKLQRALRHLLDRRLVTAWYWGHEHHAVLYDRHESWGLYGRCLGNGGVPEPRVDMVRHAPVDETHPGRVDAQAVWHRLPATAQAPACLVLDGENHDMVKEAHQRKFVPHGFMTLRFQGSDLVERVHLSDGTELFVNTIS